MKKEYEEIEIDGGCMYLGDSMNLEKIKKYGFRSVR